MYEPAFYSSVSVTGTGAEGVGVCCCGRVMGRARTEPAAAMLQAPAVTGISTSTRAATPAGRA